MTTYQFSIAGLEPSPYGFAVLLLHSTPYTHTLRVRLGAVDAQPLASELAGIQTVRSRMAATVRHVAERLDAHLAHVWLHRGTGNLIEAEVVIETTLDQIAIPLTCGDAFALALVHKLPILGDNTLESLMQPVPHTQAEEPIVLPAGVETFLSSL